MIGESSLKLPLGNIPGKAGEGNDPKSGDRPRFGM